MRRQSIQHIDAIIKIVIRFLQKGRVAVTLKTLIIITALLLLSAPRSLFAAAPDFDHDIGPLLAANCLPCHAESTRTSGFSVASPSSVFAGGNRHGKAVQAGHPEQSVLIQILQGRVSPRMPFGKVLPETDIARIEEWIRNLPPTRAHSCLSRPGLGPTGDRSTPKYRP